jgi:acyl-CoA reductase-like NAD-dependent aldehyde dehydrogenase
MYITNNIRSNLSAVSGSDASSLGGIDKNHPSFQELLSQLTDYSKGSTSDQMEKMALAQLGITPEQLRKMSPEEREKVMEKVRELMKKEVQAQTEAVKAKSGLQIDLSV